eukprot:359440-Chlamydomonas_euryale.AAC.1
MAIRARMDNPGWLRTDSVACSCRNLLDKGILCPRNEDVDLIDDTDMKLFGMYLPEPPTTHTYTSVNTYGCACKHQP